MVAKGDPIDCIHTPAKILASLFLDCCFPGFPDFIPLLGYILIFSAGKCFVSFRGQEFGIQLKLQQAPFPLVDGLVLAGYGFFFKAEQLPATFKAFPAQEGIVGIVQPLFQFRTGLLPETSLLAAAETAVYQYLAEHLPPRYVFHDFNHAKATADVAAELTVEADLPEATRNALIIAAWFHDVGYTEAKKGMNTAASNRRSNSLSHFRKRSLTTRWQSS